MRRLDDATVDEVAELLDMTVSGARQHLNALTEQGLVEATEQPRRPGERGRPRLTYRVTDLADALFPRVCQPRRASRACSRSENGRRWPRISW